MLHIAGLSVQDIFFTLDQGTGEKNYLKAKDALDKYFKPQANVPYKRLCFRELSQLPSKTVEQFVTRLRQKAQSWRNGEISLKIGGVQVTMIIDSGASCNVLDRNLWEYLKANKVRCASSKATKKLYSYGISSHCKLQACLLQMC